MTENPLRILIVDDDALDRRAAQRALLSSDLVVEIAEAESGAEALARLAGEPFDAALLDFHLPDADGLEILAEMRARGVSVPVLMLTGHGDELVAVELMKAGAADYLSKAKLTPDALARSLRNILRVRQAQEAAAQAEAEREHALEKLAAEQGQMEAVVSSMTEGLVISDLAGSVLTMNPAALALLGYARLEEIQRPLPEFAETLELTALDGRLLPLDEWPLARALRGETFSDFEVFLRRRDTGKVLTLSCGGTPARSKAGEAVLAVVTLRDITQIKKAQERAAFLADAGARLSASLDVQTTLDTVARLAVPYLTDWCAINVLDADGMIRPLVIVHVDPAEEARIRDMQRAYPLNAETPLGVGLALRTGEAQLIPHFSDGVLQAAAQAEDHLTRLRSFGICSYLCVPLQVRGKILGALSFASTRSGRIYDEDDLALAQELGRRVSTALDNARLFEEVQARAERETLINRIGQALRVSLDVDEILQIVTEQVGQALGVSRCSWARLNAARDAFEIASQQYVAPGVAHDAYTLLLAQCPPEMMDEWTAGRPVVVPDHALGEMPQVARGLTATRAFISCPVFLRGQFSGLFSVHQTDGPRAWTEDEVAFLTAITDILALALENARLYAHERRVADMLSSAFLTEIPETLPGLSLASSYKAGMEESRVGGDYYDAFPLPDGRVALVIGDVSGKGLNAAVQTATVKYSLRAFATEAGAPGLVLTRLNRMLCSESAGLGDHFVTLFYGLFDPVTGRLAYASAGHETVIVKRNAGGTDLLRATGPILGVADHGYAQLEALLSVGDALILYTDGLTEARAVGSRELMDLERVVTLVENVSPEASADALSACLEQAALAWTGGRPQDDMALLVARRLGLGEFSEEPVTPADSRPYYHRTLAWGRAVESLPAAGDALFDFTFPSRADYAAEVRQAVGHWMPTLGFDRDMTEDFQTAVTEAVTNAVRHGSPPGTAAEFRVMGRRLSDGTLRVEVTDSGRGLAAGIYPAMPDPEAVGGRGLPLIRALADSVEFRTSVSGHSVILTKRRPERTRK